MNFSQPYCYDFDRTREYFRLAATHKQWWDSSTGWDARALKGYSSLAGGYYVARLTVLAHLVGLGRQAGVLAVRVDRGELRGSAGGVGGARGGEKDHAGHAPALREPGRNIGGYGKKDQNACGALAQGGPALGATGAEEPDGVIG